MEKLMMNNRKDVFEIMHEVRSRIISEESCAATTRKYVMVIGNKIKKLGYSLSESLKCAWILMKWINPVKVIKVSKKTSFYFINELKKKLNIDFDRFNVNGNRMIVETNNYINIPGFKLKREKLIIEKR